MWSTDRPDPLTWQQISSDYDVQIRDVRKRLGMTQTQFAASVGAARKAVVSQWESRKRCPSPVSWQRIQAVVKTHAGVAAGGILNVPDVTHAHEALGRSQ